jgi:hypothetical protein
LDHRNANGVTVSDFTLKADGTIDVPAIEINRNETNQPKVSVSLLMAGAVASMIDVYEILIAYLCNESAQPFAQIQMEVGTVGDKWKRSKFTRFAFGMTMNGEFVPMG